MNITTSVRMGVVVLAAVVILMGCQPAEPVKPAVAAAPAPVVQVVSRQDLARSEAKREAAKFEMASKVGDTAEQCVRAGIVASLHLDSGNEPEYRSWKVVQKVHCDAAMRGL